MLRFISPAHLCSGGKDARSRRSWLRVALRVPPLLQLLARVRRCRQRQRRAAKRRARKPAPLHLCGKRSSSVRSFEFGVEGFFNFELEIFLSGALFPSPDVFAV